MFDIFFKEGTIHLEISEFQEITMPKDEVVTLSELRENLPEILNKVRLLGKSFIITKHGKPAFILMPPTTASTKRP